MIGTTHLFRQRNDEPFLDLHLFQCTCITLHYKIVKPILRGHLWDEEKVAFTLIRQVTS